MPLTGTKRVSHEGYRNHNAIALGYHRWSNAIANRQDLSNDRRDTRIAALNERRVFTIGPKATGKQRATLSGTITSISTGEPIIGATCYYGAKYFDWCCNRWVRKIQPRITGRATVLTIRSLGMKTTQRTVVVQSDGRLNIEMLCRRLNLKSCSYIWS